MSKKNNDSSSQPTAIDKLLADGSLTLTANSREEVYEQAEALVAAIPDGTKWTRGIVWHQDGIFHQHYLILKE